LILMGDWRGSSFRSLSTETPELPIIAPTLVAMDDSR
jgi:hypothetical protein